MLSRSAPGRASSLLIVVAALSGTAWLAAAPEPPSPAGGRDGVALPYFWDEYAAYRDLWRESPDSASAVAASLLRHDPDHLLAAWLRGRVLAGARAGADSLTAARLLARAERERLAPGLQVTAATLLYARGDATRGRAALDRACGGYQSAGRRHDACRALLWKLVLGRGGDVDSLVTSEVARAEAAARALGDPVALADVLLVRAEMEYRQSAQAALHTRTEALGLLSPLPPGFQLVECHRHLSNAYKTLGELPAARQHAARALELARSLGNRRQELLAIRAVAHVERAEGALLRARGLQLRAAALARELRESEILARCCGDLGNLFRDMGRYREAREAFAEGLRAVGPAKADPGFRAMILDDIASVDCLLGDYRDARDRYEEALAICRARGLGIRVPTILSSLAKLHLDTGDPERAAEIAEEGAAAAAVAGNRRQQVSLLLLESRALAELGREEASLAAVRSARRLARAGVPQMQWEAARRESSALAARGEWRAADAVLDSTVAALTPSADALELGVTLRAQGEVRLGAGLADRALPPLQRGLDLLSGLSDPLATAHARLSLGRCLLALGRAPAAARELERGLVELEDARGSFGAAAERIGFASTWYPAQTDLARAQIALGRPEAAFATLEQGRGRGLREAILSGPSAGGSAAWRARVPGELGEALAAVVEELGGLQAALREEYGLGPAERSPGLGAMEQRADSLKTRWSDLSRRLEREAPSAARAVGRLPTVSASEAQAALRPGERLVAYMVGADATLVFSVSSRRLDVREIPWGEQHLARRVGEFVTALREDREGVWRRAAAALADTLLGGDTLAGRVDAGLTILPDGALHLLPFEALLVADRRSGRRSYLLESAPVMYGSSATLLFHPSRRASRGGAVEGDDVPLVAFGDPGVGDAAVAPTGDVPARGPLASSPLPGARREVAALPGLIPGTRVVLGADATEQRFWAEIAHARMVHVAAHAFADDRHPEFSGIVLAPRADSGGGADDGILQAYEIAARHQDLALVTLSACETGAGRLWRGEGLMSLARAFRLMGARNLVVSLWKVDDATAMRFMTEFYRRLATGQPISLALRDCKLTLLRSRPDPSVAPPESGAAVARGVGRHPLSQRLSSPAAWAPFILLGQRGE